MRRASFAGGRRDPVLSGRGDIATGGNVGRAQAEWSVAADIGRRGAAATASAPLR